MNRKQRRYQQKAIQNQPNQGFNAQVNLAVRQKLNDAAHMLERGEVNEATQILVEVTKLDPNNKHAIELLGIAARALKQYDRAVNLFNALVQFDPQNHFKYKRYIACTYSDMQLYGEAIALFEVIPPDMLNAVMKENYAVCCIYMGDKDKARALFEEIIQENPDHVNFLYKYVHAVAEIEDEDNPYFQMLLKHAQNIDALKEDEQMRVYYALFDVYNRWQQYETAFEYAKKGAAIKNAQVNYDQDAHAQNIKNYKTFFTSELYETYEAEKICDSDRPVFIMGMPRSGTTLLEQVLSSHGDIETIGEDTFLSDLIASRNFNRHEKTWPYDVAQAYLQFLDAKTQPSARVIDKSISNTLHFGFLNLAFPNAKFVHIKRDAVDSCLSMFTHLFIEDYQSYSYDFENLATRYRAHMELMDHWHEVMPGKIYTIQYEDMVDDLETHARGLYEFLDVPWDDNCLQFYKKEGAVRTASAGQVREKLNTKSIGRWKRYGDKVKPLIEALGDLASEEAQEFLKS